MQAVRPPCRRMSRSSRVTAETRKKVRAYYRIVLRVALAVVALFALYAGEQTVVGWSHAASSSPHASGRELLASHGGGDSYDVSLDCKVFLNKTAVKKPVSNSTKKWRDECCPKPPANIGDVKAWWESCQNTEHLTQPYVACLEKWYDSAIDCVKAETYGPTAICSLNMRCSDMGMYQFLLLDVGPAGFHPGMTVPYIFFLIYIFVGLAIVCDEYFVPAIDEISEVWSITPDVTGATLMAAGGSAPELATSFMGVFVSKSNVGFSTIVGSAVRSCDSTLLASCVVVCVCCECVPVCSVIMSYTRTHMSTSWCPPNGLRAGLVLRGARATLRLRLTPAPPHTHTHRCSTCYL